MRPKLVLAVVCWSLAALASPSLADEAKAEAESPIAAMFAPAGCGTLTMIGTPEPLFMTCTVQVECADNSVISCSGSSCSSGGPSNSCVICNGAQQSCCTGPSCCQVCEENYFACLDTCDPFCNYCQHAYDHCVANCTGGCP